MKPKQYIRYTKWLDKNNLAICDGVTQEFHASLFDMLYPLFILSGIGIFLWIVVKWGRIKEIIRGK